MAVLEALKLDGKVLIVLSEHDPLVRRAAGNLPNVFITVPNGVSLLDVLNAETVVITASAASEIGRRFISESDEADAADDGEMAQ